MEKQSLKIFFCDFWQGFDKEDNLFIALLSRSFSVEISENPDVLFYSCYGFEFLKFRCHRIFYTAENIRPDHRECDYSLTFDHDHYNGKNLRLPLYLFSDLKHLEKGNELPLFHNPKTRFCNMVVSNPNGKERNLFFDLLNKKMAVDSGGKFKNNTGSIVKDKLEFIANYRFTIAFENSSYPGYTTEKLVHPMLAGSIPIYWGNPLIAREFNNNSFINIHEFGSFNQVINRIIEIEKNPSLYKEMRQEPWLIHNAPMNHQDYKYLAKRFREIIYGVLSNPSIAKKSASYSRYQMWKKRIISRLTGKAIWYC